MLSVHSVSAGHSAQPSGTQAAGTAPPGALLVTAAGAVVKSIVRSIWLWKLSPWCDNANLMAKLHFKGCVEAQSYCALGR